MATGGPVVVVVEVLVEEDVEEVEEVEVLDVDDVLEVEVELDVVDEDVDVVVDDVNECRCARGDAPERGPFVSSDDSDTSCETDPSG